ncbi:MAG: dihydroxy-acid dehydratase [Thermodesulfobacteriota bacterium]
MADIDAAGGVPAVLNRLKDMLQNNPTVTGKSILEVAEAAAPINSDVIRDLKNPYHQEGGIAVLKGNIADSAIVKQTAVDSDLLVHTGPAKVFYSEQELLDAIGDKRIAEGDVVILPFQGPAGAPGMPEMLTPTDAIKGAGYKRVALVTDGRFSGATTGLSVGHVEMEAFNGGMIGAIKDGDIIEIDIPQRKLNARISDSEARKRLSAILPPERKLTPMLEHFRQAYKGKNCYGK